MAIPPPQLNGIVISEPNFRLRFFFAPGYLAARLHEIRSVRDFTSRFFNIFIYIAKHALLKPAKAVVWALLVKPSWVIMDAVSDATLSTTIDKFQPRRIPRPVKNPPSKDTVGIHKCVRLSWNIQIACNHDCPYCWFHGKWQEYQGKAVILSAKEWSTHWSRFNDRYGPAHIDIAGGEPFTYPGFIDILAMLSMRNTILAITNFAWDPSKVIGRIDPAKVDFSCSFHPEFAPSPEVFADKVARLREAGFYANVSIVAYPPYLKRLAEWSDAFFSRGIYLTVLPFRGWWKGRYYPTAYTATGRRGLDWFMNGEFLRFYPEEVVCAAFPARISECKTLIRGRIAKEYQLNLKQTKETLCNSGKLYGRLQFDGNMLRCSQGGHVGNFLSEDFRMHDDAKPCPHSNCECINEVIYLQGCQFGPNQASTPV